MLAAIEMPVSDISGCCTSASATALPVAVTVSAPVRVMLPAITPSRSAPYTRAFAWVPTFAVAAFVLPEITEPSTLPAD